MEKRHEDGCRYDRVDRGRGVNALTLSVTARTACREAVQLRTVIDSFGQQVHLLANQRRLQAASNF